MCVWPFTWKSPRLPLTVHGEPHGENLAVSINTSAWIVFHWPNLPHSQQSGLSTQSSTEVDKKDNEHIENYIQITQFPCINFEFAAILMFFPHSSQQIALNQYKMHVTRTHHLHVHKNESLKLHFRLFCECLKSTLLNAVVFWFAGLWNIREKTRASFILLAVLVFQCVYC